MSSGGNDFGYDDVEEIPDDVNEIVIEKQTFKMSNMSNSNFRNKLVTSFHKRWEKKYRVAFTYRKMT